MPKKPRRRNEAANLSKPGGAAAARTQATSDRPATYREVFGVGEYRAVFTASVLSWIGDYFAKVAISYLIFSDTGSVLYSAAAFAISYLPWVAGGPVLAAVAERYPYRTVMIICDLVRMSLVALLAIPGTPLPVLLVLLFTASMLTPPAQSARSALIPRLLKGDRYVVGLSAQATAAQAAQVAGYAAGGALSAAVNPRAALLVDAATFALSALVIWRGVKPRPAAMGPEHRSHLLRETAEGFRVVFGNPVMRPIAFVVFALVSVVIVPEGLAAGWSEAMGGGAWRAGLLMASLPLGYVAGAIVVGRIMTPSTRIKLIRPLAVLTPLVLIPALTDPPFPVVIAIAMAAGFANSAIMPLNGLFVQLLPNAYRARAFGIMQGGMQILHAVAVLVTGAIAEWFKVPTVVGAWSAVGLLLILLAVSTWPSPTVVDEQIAHATVINQRDVPQHRAVQPDEAGEAGEATTPAPSPTTRTTGRAVDGAAVDRDNGKISAGGPNHPHEGETVRL